MGPSPSTLTASPSTLTAGISTFSQPRLTGNLGLLLLPTLRGWAEQGVWPL